MYRRDRGHLFGDIEDTFLGSSDGILNWVLVLWLWRCGHRTSVFERRSDAHKSTGLEIDGAEALVAEEHIEEPVLIARTQGDGLAAKGFADPDGPVLEADGTADIDFAHRVGRTVLDRGQLIGKAPFARFVACARRLKLQRIVWTLVIVDLAPRIESLLTIG